MIHERLLSLPTESLIPPFHSGLRGKMMNPFSINKRQTEFSEINRPASPQFDSPASDNAFAPF